MQKLEDLVSPLMETSVQLKQMDDPLPESNLFEEFLQENPMEKVCFSINVL